MSAPPEASTDLAVADLRTESRTVAGFAGTHLLLLWVLAGVVIARHDGAEQALAVAIAVVMTATLVWFAQRLRCWYREPGDRFRFGWPTIIIVVVQVAGWLVLVQLDDAPYELQFTLYPLTYMVLPLVWAVPVTMVLALRTILSEVGDPEPSVLVYAVSIFGVVGGGAFAAWIHRIHRTIAERRQLIAELHATRDDLAAAERAAGTEAERRRFAADIHDTLAQGFTSIVLLARDARRRCSDSELEAVLDRLESVATANLEEARRLVAAEGPEDLDHAALPEAVAAMARRSGGAAGITVHVHVDGEVVGLDGAVSVALYRAAQELVTNAVRHARAGRIDVTLSFLAGAVALDVHDDGRGWADATRAHDDMAEEATADAGTALVGGHGLALLRQRIAAVGGEVDIDSGADRGTVVSVVVPLAAAAPTVAEARA